MELFLILLSDFFWNMEYNDYLALMYFGTNLESSKKLFFSIELDNFFQSKNWQKAEVHCIDKIIRISFITSVLLNVS